MPGIDRYTQAKKNYFNVDEANQQRPEDIKPVLSLKDIAREALNKKLWIYDPSSKQWHSPEEFLTKYERVTSGNDQFLKQVELKCPFDGIMAAHQQINSIQMRLQEFSKRVIEYYKNK